MLYFWAYRFGLCDDHAQLSDDHLVFYWPCSLLFGWSSCILSIPGLVEDLCNPCLSCPSPTVASRKGHLRAVKSELKEPTVHIHTNRCFLRLLILVLNFLFKMCLQRYMTYSVISKWMYFVLTMLYFLRIVSHFVGFSLYGRLVFCTYHFVPLADQLELCVGPVIHLDARFHFLQWHWPTFRWSSFLQYLSVTIFTVTVL